MKTNALQIGYEPEYDCLIWDGWDIHCGQGLDVAGSYSVQSPLSSWYMPGCLGVSWLLWARESKDG